MTQQSEHRVDFMQLFSLTGVFAAFSMASDSSSTVRTRAQAAIDHELQQDRAAYGPMISLPKRANTKLIKLALASIMCTHDIRASDKHHAVCEACRRTAGIHLCDYVQCCRACADLDDVEFDRMLDDREANRHRNELRRKRKRDQRAHSSDGKRHHDQDPSPPTATGDAASAVNLAGLQVHPDTQLPGVIAALSPMDNASYRQLLEWKVPVHQFLSDRQLHPWTALHVSTNQGLMDIPLHQVAAQMDAQYPNARELVPSGLALPSAAPGAAQFDRPGVGSRDFLADDYIPDKECQPDDDRLSSTTERSATPADFACTDLPVDPSQHDAEADPKFPDVLRLIAETVPSVLALEPPSRVQRRATDPSYLTKTEPKVRLGLTTAELVKNTILNRFDEYTEQLLRGKAGAYGRLSSTTELKVKLASYHPGDQFWPLRAPIMSPDYGRILPVPRRSDVVGITSADMENLDFTARCLLRCGSTMDSAFSTLMQLVPVPTDNPLLDPLLRWIGSIIRDQVRLSAYISTSLTILRRDQVLMNSQLNFPEKNKLRGAPMHDQTLLFPDDLATEVVAAVRRRNQDYHMNRGFGLVFIDI